MRNSAGRVDLYTFDDMKFPDGKKIEVMPAAAADALRNRGKPGFAQYYTADEMPGAKAEHEAYLRSNDKPAEADSTTVSEGDAPKLKAVLAQNAELTHQIEVSSVHLAELRQELERLEAESDEKAQADEASTAGEGEEAESAPAPTRRKAPRKRT